MTMIQCDSDEGVWHEQWWIQHRFSYGWGHGR